MCFGPTPSFVSSFVLTVIGVAALKQVRGSKILLIAVFPLIFAFHQFNEGLLWMILKYGYAAQAQPMVTFTFLFIALFFWPIYTPVSIYILEPNTLRKKLMLPFILLGVITGCHLFSTLLYNISSASVINCSITYDFGLPESQEIVMTIMYLGSIFGATLFSTYHVVVLIGIINFILCCIAGYIYFETFISVWCFFASLLSVMIYLILRKPSQKPT